jgi:hypothetical protein
VSYATAIQDDIPIGAGEIDDLAPLSRVFPTGKARSLAERDRSRYRLVVDLLSAGRAFLLRLCRLTLRPIEHCVCEVTLKALLSFSSYMLAAAKWHRIDARRRCVTICRIRAFLWV